MKEIRGRSMESINEIKEAQETFQPREPGITHPDNDAYIRLRDNGDVEIVAQPGLAIVMHQQTKGITFVCDNIKFITRDQNGLRWNNRAFNPQSTNFAEPALIPFDAREVTSIYDGVENFLPDESDT